MKNVFLFCLISIIFINYAFCVSNFIINLEPGEEMCLDEYFSDKTLVIYTINSNIQTTSVKIIDPNDQTLHQKENLLEFKESFTTFIGGYYQSCMKNSSPNESAEIHFDLRSGVAAKDYSEVAKSKDLKPVELDLQKLEDKSQEIYHLMSFAAAHEQIFENMQDSLTSKVSFFSILLIGSMIAIGLLEVFYVNKHIINRKNI